jgi:alkanesulfonate monooxygenase SsuD/methylene tetrahydromethanopterin reductase-like flavin-dependent oxidoreductase (luciferase family)
VRDAARVAGRDPAALTGAMYVTLAIDDDSARAEARINAYLAQYYGVPAALMRQRQACFGGPAAAAAAWLKGYADAGAGHLVLRFAGEHERHLDAVARLRREMGW